MSERSVRLTINGRVQGVGFRMFVEAEARARGLRGWVRNRRDGAVEALIAGRPDVVEAMIAACRRGTQAARVEAVVVEDAPEALQDVGGTFSVLPTC
jgi:acylphosphatase